MMIQKIMALVFTVVGAVTENIEWFILAGLYEIAGVLSIHLNKR